jgi:hypothetical protein
MRWVYQCFIKQHKKPGEAGERPGPFRPYVFSRPTKILPSAAPACAKKKENREYYADRIRYRLRFVCVGGIAEILRGWARDRRPRPTLCPAPRQPARAGAIRLLRSSSQSEKPRSSRAFKTRSALTPPLRAIAKPQRIRSSSAIEWASGLMLKMQPSSSPR